MPSHLGRALLALLLPCVPLLAQSRGVAVFPQASSQAEVRVALVIGNSAYKDAPLKNPVNDARAMAAKLTHIGFEVVLRENLTQKQIGATLREFRSRLSPGAEALFFYAGHGLQVNGVNYLPAVDADISAEEDVPTQSIDLTKVLELMEAQKTRLNLVFLDACRNNPYTRGFRAAGGGLAKFTPPSGTILSYATRPGSVAADGSGTHGLYTEHLLKAMDETGVIIEQALKKVLTAVKRASNGRQEPWIEGGIEGDFYFVPAGAAPQNAPGGQPAPTARPGPSIPATAHRQEGQLPGQETRDPVTGLTLCWIPAGSFTMGSPTNEEGRNGNEGPQHRVFIPRGFWMGRTEVTQAQWQAVMGSDPSYFKNAGANAPVEQVSWNDAKEFLQKLNQRSTAFTYRLPSEAEWEYACRAGTSTATYAGSLRILGANNGPALDPIAWYGGNSGVEYAGAYDSSKLPEKQEAHTQAGTHLVGQKRANAWGLHDMLGNVWEWCEDIWHAKYDGAPVDGSAWVDSSGSIRVIRGGSWSSGPGGVRSALHNAIDPVVRNSDIGLRVVAIARTP
jgi:formylglycine-generating enzyme required for sulfatase activity